MSPCHQLYLCKILAIEDAKGLLQGLDFLFPPGNAVLIGHTSLNARRLQLIEVVESGVEFFLSALKVGLLLGSLVHNVPALAFMVNLRVSHEGLILLLRSG